MGKYTVYYYDGNISHLARVEAADEYEALRAYDGLNEVALVIEGWPVIFAEEEYVIRDHVALEDEIERATQPEGG